MSFLYYWIYFVDYCYSDFICKESDRVIFLGGQGLLYEDIFVFKYKSLSKTRPSNEN